MGSVFSRLIRKDFLTAKTVKGPQAFSSMGCCTDEEKKEVVLNCWLNTLEMKARTYPEHYVRKGKYIVCCAPFLLIRPPTDIRFMLAFKSFHPQCLSY